MTWPVGPVTAARGDRNHYLAMSYTSLTSSSANRPLSHAPDWMIRAVQALRRGRFSEIDINKRYFLELVVSGFTRFWLTFVLKMLFQLKRPHSESCINVARTPQTIGRWNLTIALFIYFSISGKKERDKIISAKIELICTFYRSQAWDLSWWLLIIENKLYWILFWLLKLCQTAMNKTQ